MNKNKTAKWVNKSPLHHYTPLRYPGGKGKLASYIKEIIKQNELLDGEYAEPYAGGCAIGLELLFHEYVSRIHINDLSRPVFSFWKSVLDRTDDLCKLIHDTPLTLRSWDNQKRIFQAEDDYDDLELGFATFFLNRTNRSGILNGGVIGGRQQKGPWKIDARFNRANLIYRIEEIAKRKKRISLTGLDAIKFLDASKGQWPSKTLVYLDPPYFVKGRDLYYDYYNNEDHAALCNNVTNSLKGCNWLVSYDNVPTIRSLYKGCQQVVYGIGYSAREVREGSEVMFFSNELKVPSLVGPFRLIRRVAKANLAVRSAGSLASRVHRSKSIRRRG